MTDAEQREAARQFINKWRTGGDEKQDCHPYWIQLLQNVLGVNNATEYIQFEKPVKLPERDGRVHTRYIDGYIPAVNVLIEQKGSAHKLDEKETQSGGEMLTPYEQAKRYSDNLPYGEKARWIVTCNFLNIWIYDMNSAVPEPQKIELPDLQSKKSIAAGIRKFAATPTLFAQRTQPTDKDSLLFHVFLRSGEDMCQWVLLKLERLLRTECKLFPNPIYMTLASWNLTFIWLGCE